MLSATIIGVALLGFANALPSPHLESRQSGWPNAPFTTKGRDIINNQGDVITYAGVNWPGAADTMLPEGLQYQSIADIVSKIKQLGMNVIRLTYAIEMIDDIYSENPNSTLKGTLVNALGSENGSAVLAQIMSKNPQFTESTTRLETFDAVAAECAKQEIYVHLDNHMSSAAWCCSTTDGNGWFGDNYFNVDNWKRGLAYMADHAKSWPAYVSSSLRNELRDPGSDSPAEAYGWANWYPNMIAAADAINQANPDPLIFFSGLGFDVDLGNVTKGRDLGDGQVFDISSFSYADKVVFELHNYQNSLSDSDCTSFGNGLYSSGYDAMDNSSTTTAKNVAPVVLTEFGFQQDDSTYMQPYAQCVKEYITSVRGGWMQWVLSGSYYIRTGTQDFDETWGLLTHDWSDWRSSSAVNDYTIPFAQATLG